MANYNLQFVGSEIDTILQKIKDGYGAGEGLILEGTTFRLDRNVLTQIVKEVTGGSVPTVVSPTSVSLNKTSLNINYNSSTTLVATISPSNANKDTALTWTSSDTSVATVSSSGVVKGVAQRGGTCTITVSTANGKKATCSVTVADSVVRPTGVTLSSTNLNLNYNSTSNLTATIVPSNANTDTALTWTSSNTNVATVSSTGSVRGVARDGGTCTITVTTANGKSATCSVTVNAYVEEPKILIGNIKFESEVENPEDVATVLTESVIDDAKASTTHPLYECALNSVLTGVKNVTADNVVSFSENPNTKATSSGRYNYHIVMIPSDYSDSYRAAYAGLGTEGGGVFGLDAAPTFYGIYDKRITYKGKQYSVYAYYFNIKNSAGFYELTIIKK